MLCSTVDVHENHALSQEKLEDCRRSLKSLKSACKKFTANNLRGIDEPLANSWILLFQLNINKLKEEDLKVASENFELIFKDRKVRNIFLTNLLPYCEEALKQTESRGVLLLKKACQYLSEDTLKPIGRDISINWFKLIEAHEEKLECKDLSAVVAVHKEFSLVPDEIQKRITVTGFDEQKDQFPLMLLMTHSVFHEKIFLKQPLLFPQTSILVLQAFETYLYKKRLPYEQMSQELYVQLLDIARGIQDKKLVDLCLQKLKTSNSNLKQASIAAVNGDNAASFDKKRHYLDAVRLRPTDMISYKALGNIAFEQKKYREAALYFEKSLEAAPIFSEGLKLCQCVVEYLKAFENSARAYLSDLLILKKKFIVAEHFQNSLDLFLKQIGPFISENELELSEPLITLSKGITSISDLKVFEESFKERVESVVFSLLNKAKIALKDIPEKTSEYYLLEGEISYQIGTIQKAFNALSKVKMEEVDEFRFLNLFAKLELSHGNIDSAKSYLRQALGKDPNHPDLLKTLILMGDSAGDIIPTDTQNNELLLTLGFTWYQNEDLEKAKEYYFKASFYDPRGAFILGKILKCEDHYFKRALQLNVNGDLDSSYCIEIAEFFLKEGKVKELIPFVSEFKPEVMQKIQQMDFPQKEELIKDAANLMLEEMEFSSGNTEAGIEMKEAYLPENVPERLLEVEQLLENQQWVEAEQILEKLKSYYPFETDIDLKWVKLDLKKKDYKPATRRLSIIKTQDPSEEFIQLYSDAIACQYDSNKEHLEKTMNPSKSLMELLNEELLALTDSDIPIKISPRALKGEDLPAVSTLFRDVSEMILDHIKNES